MSTRTGRSIPTPTRMCWLAIGVMLDDVTPENGPLQSHCSGSHGGPIHDHQRDGAFVGAIDVGRSGLDVRDGGDADRARRRHDDPPCPRRARLGAEPLRPLAPGSVLRDRGGGRLAAAHLSAELCRLRAVLRRADGRGAADIAAAHGASRDSHARRAGRGSKWIYNLQLATSAISRPSKTPGSPRRKYTRDRAWTRAAS